MPIPFIIAGAAAAAALGVGKSIKAGIDNSEAKDVNRRANEKIDYAKEHLELCRTKSGKALEALGSKKLFVLDNSVKRFVNGFEKLQNVDLADSGGLNELDKFRLDKQSLTELKEMGDYASSILGGTVGGALSGALTAFGAYSGVMAFGAASTGTAIATLSGAAATNATLAFLGGGSLAAGGLGMAGGAMVLGGLVAGPALAIMGFVVGAKAKANLDNAYSNLAEAAKIEEELETASVLCNGIRRRAYMFERLLIRLEVLFVPLIYRMESIIAARGVDWRRFQKEEQQTIAAAASIAKAIKTVIDTPILTEDGKLTDDSKQIAEKMKADSKQIAEKVKAAADKQVKPGNMKKDDAGSPDVGEVLAGAADKVDAVIPVVAAIKNEVEKIVEGTEYKELTYAEVIRYFIDQKDNPKVAKGAMIKEELEGRYRIIQVFLDKDNNLIEDAKGTPLGCKLKAKTLDSELLQVFKNNQVVIVE